MSGVPPPPPPPPPHGRYEYGHPSHSNSGAAAAASSSGGTVHERDSRNWQHGGQPQQPRPAGHHNAGTSNRSGISSSNPQPMPSSYSQTLSHQPSHHVAVAGDTNTSANTSTRSSMQHHPTASAAPANSNNNSNTTNSGSNRQARAYAYATNRMASSSFGDFHIGHTGGSTGSASASASRRASGYSDAPGSNDGYIPSALAPTVSGAVAPMSSVGIPSAAGGRNPRDDADAAAGLRAAPSSESEYGQYYHHHHPNQYQQHVHQQHHQQQHRSSSTGRRRRLKQTNHNNPRHNAMDAFRDSEADFLQLHSAASIGGGSTVSGYVSGADSIITLPSPPTSGGPGVLLNLPGIAGATTTTTTTGGSMPTKSGEGERVHVGAGTGGGGGGGGSRREQLLVLGIDISHLSRKSQFIYCAGGVFFFSLLYGFLQELISVTLCCRQLGLFLAVAQFSGYTFWSYLLREYVNEKQARHRAANGEGDGIHSSNSAKNKATTRKKKFGWGTGLIRSIFSRDGESSTSKKGPQGKGSIQVPISMYLGLSILRAIDLGATNLAMQYVNYPAKTLMKSARVVFTMLFGVLVAKRRYKMGDYAVVMLMVAGLAIFMHADANSDAIFEPFGIMLLVLSLSCDGAISNMSESLMNQFGVGQDEFIFRLYSIATMAIAMAAAAKGDLAEGARFLLLPGTYDEINKGEEPTWSVGGKVAVVVLFSTMGFFGSSCSAAITKHFGALTMSITSTARKATTLFLSFAFFNNVCTVEHVGGIALFITALVMKSLRASRKGRGRSHGGRRKRIRRSPAPALAAAETKPLMSSNIEIGSGAADPTLHQRKNISPSHVCTNVV